MDQGLKSARKTHPKETANLVSLLTFFYSLRLFKKGFTKDLEEEDLYEVLSSCRSKQLGDQLENGWMLQRKTSKKPCLVRVLWSCFGKTYMMFGVMQFIFRTVLVLTMPHALGKLVSYFSPGQTELTKEDAVYYAVLLIGLNVFNHVYTQNYLLALTEFGIRIRTAICSFVYRKALKMSEAALAEITMGKIVTLITKDIFAVEMVVLFGNDIWIGLAQAGLICYLIYGKIGAAAFAGVGFFLVVLPLQVIIGKIQTGVRLKTSKKTDERLQMTQQILSSMKIIKLYAWESFFKNKISILRKKEYNAIFILFTLKIIIFIIGGLSNSIAFYLLIMTYVWMGNYINAEIVYFIQSCFHKLSHLLTIILPLGIIFGAEFKATLVRLASILNAEEVPTPRNHIQITTKDPAIVLNRVAVKAGKVAIIKELTMEIKKGLNIVLGCVGSGKTLFLKTILEDYKIDGSLTIYGNVSYASQDPWLFPSSIKHNILFGEGMDQKRYNRVLAVCALNQDLKAFPRGDSTIIGDNGVNLSKGQQARVNLARAIYKTADIYLLDDCLAALDGHVSDYIFKECILDFLKDKLCVFVSNNYDYIRAADRIIKISEGNISYSDNLMKKDFKLATNKETEGAKSCERSEAVEKEGEETEIYKEQKKTGAVDFTTYKRYIKFGGGFCVFGLILVVFAIKQTIASYSDKLVSNWVTLEQNLSAYQMLNQTNSSEFLTKKEERTNILNLYTIIIITVTLMSLGKALSFFAFNRKACINLHKEMITKIINAKMAFFDSHLIGNVLNRFSKDLCTIDEHLSSVWNECFDILFIFIGVIFLIVSVNPIFLIPFSIFFVLIYFARFIYLRTGRSLQRLEASTRSPLIGHLNASLEGLTTIRAFKAQDIIKAEFDRHQDLYTSASYILQNSMRSLAFVLDSMCSIFIATVILRFLIVDDDTTVGNVGLAISQTFHLSGFLQYGIRRWADFESQMTSVERVLQYTEAEQEKTDGRIVKDWPNVGRVIFDKVSLSFGDRKVLKDVTFTIGAKQKIGIVGRTGAGKSSIISTLFQLYDVEGTIRIDGVDVRELNLNFLRSNIAIIPQDPVLVSGTVRENFDPLSKHGDEEVWKVVRTVNLQDVITDLSRKMDSCSLSAGQKQLICLARAILRNNKIVVLDEATANLDNETDCLMRSVIEESFAPCTVITIAHRLSSVMASSVVMVVDDGKIVEYDDPRKLLEDKSSLFFEMIKQT